MAESPKTRAAAFDPDWFDGLDPPSRGAEGRALREMFARATGWEPRMWGPSIVGFGRYVYRYDSGHSGETFVTGFSPRKAEISLYGLALSRADLLAALGPHRAGKGCLYVRRLSAVDPAVLTALIAAGVADTRAAWPVHPY